MIYIISGSDEITSRSTVNEAWLSLVERRVRDAEVAGSNPVASMQNLIRPVGQGVKTPPSHGGNRGSIPLQAMKNFRWISEVFCFTREYRS